ncbi:hypothetical protein PMAYCL1PPCAC_17197, partial [Pristionchus mayeri]
SEWTMVLLHVIVSVLHAYGCFSGRPAFVRPMVANCIASSSLLLIYLLITIYVIFNVNFPATNSVGDLFQMNFETTQKRHLTIGGTFFVLYLLWDAIILYDYFDIKQRHRDFMYWIVEERMMASQTMSTDR